MGQEGRGGPRLSPKALAHLGDYVPMTSLIFPDPSVSESLLKKPLAVKFESGYARPNVAEENLAGKTTQTRSLRAGNWPAVGFSDDAST